MTDEEEQRYSQNLLVKLSTLHSDVVIPTQLVGHIHSTHEAVVEINILRARNVSHTSILGTTLDGGRCRGRGICRHDINQLRVSPYGYNQVIPLPNTALTPFKVTCEKYER